MVLEDVTERVMLAQDATSQPGFTGVGSLYRRRHGVGSRVRERGGERDPPPRWKWSCVKLIPRAPIDGQLYIMAGSGLQSELIGN